MRFKVWQGVVIMVAAIALLILGFEKHHPRYTPEESLPEYSTSPSQDQEVGVLMGVKIQHLSPIEIPRNYLWGAGKFVAFDLSVPFGEELRIEELTIEQEGATDEEMTEAWLRFNNVRVYTTAPFKDGIAVFRAFPPLDPEEYKNISQEIIATDVEEQLVLKVDNLPVVLSSEKSTNFGIYGTFGKDIALRSTENGIRFCLKEIRGTLLGSGEKVVTRLTPTCWERMGIVEMKI